MNISTVEKRDNYARIDITLTKDDYLDKVEKQIKEYSKKANIPGFRKGHVPAGMVRKMYGDGIKLDVIQDELSEGLYNHMKDEGYKILGQPLPTEESSQIDLLGAEDLTYSFEVALVPEITDLLTKEDTLPLYKIKTTDEEVEEMLRSSLQNAGQMVEVDTVEAEDFVSGSIHELEGDLPKEGGLSKEDNAMILVKYIKDEEERNKFIGIPKNSVVIFNPYKAFEGNRAELSSLFGIQGEEVDALEGKEFSFEISQIRRHKDAELGQEFYDRVFGEGEVKSEEEARQRIREYIEARTMPDTNMKFLSDLKEYVKEHKIAGIELDEKTLKRWYRTTEGGSKIPEDEYDKVMVDMIEDLKVDLYLNALKDKHNIEVSDEEIEGFAQEMTAMQFRQYGMSNIPTEVIADYAKDILKKDDTRKRIRENISEQKMANAVKDDVTLEENMMTQEEFSAMVNPQEDKKDMKNDPSIASSDNLEEGTEAVSEEK